MRVSFGPNANSQRLTRELAEAQATATHTVAALKRKHTLDLEKVHAHYRLGGQHNSNSNTNTNTTTTQGDVHAVTSGSALPPSVAVSPKGVKKPPLAGVRASVERAASAGKVAPSTSSAPATGTTATKGKDDPVRTSATLTLPETVKQLQATVAAQQAELAAAQSKLKWYIENQDLLTTAQSAGAAVAQAHSCRLSRPD